MIKEAKKHDDERDVIKVDIPFEEWDKGDCVTIHITGQRVVNNTFYKLICKVKYIIMVLNHVKKMVLFNLLMKME
jgi:hypothetical protein